MAAAFWQRMFDKGDVFVAIEKGDLERCRELVAGDRAVLTQTDDLGRTPLHAAAHERRQVIVEFLLAAGADLNTRDAEGATPLHWAAVGGDPDVIQRLLAAGADVNAVDRNSLTPGELAKMRGHAGAAELLGRFRRRP